MLRQGQLSLPTSEMLDVKNVEKPDLDGYRTLLDDITKQLSTLKDEQRHVYLYQKSDQNRHPDRHRLQWIVAGLGAGFDHFFDKGKHGRKVHCP